MTGAQARLLREKLGVSPTDFARGLGVTKGTVYHWESGRNGPGGRALRQLRLLWAKNIQGPQSVEEAVGLLAAHLDIEDAAAAKLLLVHQRAEGETWARAVERVVTLEEARRSSLLTG